MSGSERRQTTIRPQSGEIAPLDLPRAKPLRREPGPDPLALVPARMINEVLYCARLAYLEWVQHEFQDNFFTVDGRAAHKRADRGSGALPAEDDDRPFVARSAWLSSHTLGITSKIDVVEGEGGLVEPVEYKRGKAPPISEGAYLPERAQVAAQVLLLREHGYRCEGGSLYFVVDRRRVRVDVDDALERVVLQAVETLRALASTGTLPPPLRADPRCRGCSLVSVCLPDEIRLLQERECRGEPLDDGPDCEEAPLDDEGAQHLDGAVGERTSALKVRRLIPRRDDKAPLYVQEQGARIGVQGHRLIVTNRDGTKSHARLPNTSAVSLFGNVQISTQALRELMNREIPVAFHSTGGWYLGRTVAHESKNVELRRAQYRAADDTITALRLAKGWVTAKILNCRTILRRNHEVAEKATLHEMRRLARTASDANDLQSLLGIEGTAARIYFGAFDGMLKQQRGEFEMRGRNRRPPTDPINALLSLAYSLLTREITVAVARIGLDPLLGFYHQPRFGRPALALDLMEEFRPLIADSTVITAINTGVVGAEDFTRGACSVQLTTAGRRRFVEAYERRLAQETRHPLFDYRISYRRLLEVQTRLFSRVLLGELESYPSFRTR